MAAEHRQSVGEMEADARMQIQEIIEDLNLDQLNLTEPGNPSLDKKIALLDQIFTEYVKGGDNDKAVDVSQARLDMIAFCKLASINHQRIRRVAASNWTFRATDFANRIVRLVNVEESSQSESLNETTKVKLDKMIQPHFNHCVPLKPLLGAFTFTKVETVRKETRQRQPRTQDKVVAQQLQPKKLTEISDEDQNSKVAKHVEYIMSCLAKEFKANDRKPISFYRFVMDPTSFSNSVENIFYVSFLIKDGFVAIDEDGENGLPSLSVVNKRHRETVSQTSVSKKQLILSLDQETWQAICKGLCLTSAAIDPKSRNNTFHKRPRHE